MFNKDKSENNFSSLSVNLRANDAGKLSSKSDFENASSIELTNIHKVGGNLMINKELFQNQKNSKSDKNINNIIDRKKSKNVSKFKPTINETDKRYTSQKIINVVQTNKINIDYMCNIFSYCIGYESIWRFPYFFIDGGGCAFFIPFLIFYFLLGIPLFTIESALGQLFKKNPNEIFLKVTKKALGFSLIFTITGYIIVLYLSDLTASSLYYFFLSFQPKLPWEFHLNKEKLYDSEFFKKFIVNHDSTHQNFNIYKLGDIITSRLFCSMIVWFIFYLLLVTNLKLNNKLKRIINIAPVILIFILFFSCFTITKGFSQGFLFFLVPKVNKILDHKTWIFGINQAIFVLMLGTGKNYICSKENAESENIYFRSTFSALIILLTGLFSTFITCIYAGVIAEELDIDNIQEIPINNLRFSIVSYLVALGTMKYSRILSILFLFFLTIVGIQTQYFVLNIYTDELQKLSPKYFNEQTAPMIFCLFSFLFCLTFDRLKGQFFLEWIDKNITMVPLMVVVLLEIIIIMTHFGIYLLRELIANKTNIVLPLYVFYFTKFITPFVLIFVLILVFFHNYNNPSNSISTKITRYFIFLSPFVIIIFFFLKNCFIKNDENVLFEKPENSRKASENMVIIDEGENTENPEIQKSQSFVGYFNDALSVNENDNNNIRDSSLSKKNKHKLSSSIYDDIGDDKDSRDDIDTGRKTTTVIEKRKIREKSIEMDILEKKSK